MLMKNTSSRTLLLPVLLTAAVALLLRRCHGWSDEDLLLPPIINSSNRFLATNVELDVRFSKTSADQEEESDASIPDSAASLSSPASSSSSSSSSSPSSAGSPPLQQQSLSSSSSQCNISVQRLLPTSLVARWDSSSFGFQCDVLIYTTNNHGRAFFSAAVNRAISPVVVEHLGVSGGQQELRLCVGCGMSRYRRFGHQGRGRGQQEHSGDPVSFCCLDFSLDELKGDKSWRLNRKPIESTLVACFMTLVIIVWSVAALIWPVPIIAGFLPNGMEQRRPR